MKTYLNNLIAMLFPFTVDCVIARFERDVERLETLAQSHRDAGEMHAELAEEFYAMSEDSHDEADRADRVAAKIAALLD